MRAILLTLAAAVIAAAAASAARADFRSDPRKCIFNRPAQCAGDAAKTALRVAMSAREGHPWKPGTDPRWDADITCTPVAASKLLKWRCSYQAAPGSGISGHALIWFRATSTGWHRIVTVTPAP